MSGFALLGIHVNLGNISAETGVAIVCGSILISTLYVFRNEIKIFLSGLYL